MTAQDTLGARGEWEATTRDDSGRCKTMGLRKRRRRHAQAFAPTVRHPSCAEPCAGSWQGKPEPRGRLAASGLLDDC